MTPGSFRRRLRSTLEKADDALALVHHSPERGEVGATTWRELDRMSAAYARRLAAAGVMAGQFVCLIGPAGVDLVACFLACIRLGAIGSIFPPPSPVQDAAYYVRQQTKALQTVEPHHLIVVGAVDGVGEALSDVLATVHVIVLGGDQAEGTAAAPPWAELDDGVLFVQHSSGTTGIKKGVTITDRQLALQLDAYADFLGLRREGAGRPTIASWLPLYHDMGLVACLLLSLHEGGTLILLDPFEWVSAPTSLFDAVERYRAEYVWLPNFAFRFLTRVSPRGSKRDLSSVKLWINCSEPCRLETVVEFAERFAPNGVAPSRIGCCYAMAETVFAISQTPPGEAPWHLRLDRGSLRVGQPIGSADETSGLAVVSNGPVLPGVEMRVRTDRWEGEGVLGELCVRAPFLFEGYFRRPELTESAFLDGFYRTGDIGFTRDGEVYVTGRSKEMIIVHGKNIFATDIEALANEVTGVKGGRCVAFGLESAASGSEDMIIVAERDGASSASTDEIRRALSEHVAREFGINPRDVMIVEERWLVKSTSGKISRGENKAKYLSAMETRA